MKSISDMKLKNKILSFIITILLGVISAIVIGPIFDFPISSGVFLVLSNILAQYLMSLKDDYDVARSIYEESADKK